MSPAYSDRSSEVSRYPTLQSVNMSCSMQAPVSDYSISILPTPCGYFCQLPFPILILLSNLRASFRVTFKMVCGYTTTYRTGYIGVLSVTLPFSSSYQICRKETGRWVGWSPMVEFHSSVVKITRHTLIPSQRN